MNQWSQLIVFVVTVVTINAAMRYVWAVAGVSRLWDHREWMSILLLATVWGIAQWAAR